jgi:hypothetical protein
VKGAIRGQQTGNRDLLPIAPLIQALMPSSLVHCGKRHMLNRQEWRKI